MILECKSWFRSTYRSSCSPFSPVYHEQTIAGRIHQVLHVVISFKFHEYYTSVIISFQFHKLLVYVLHTRTNVRTVQILTVTKCRQITILFLTQIWQLKIHHCMLQCKYKKNHSYKHEEEEKWTSKLEEKNTSLKLFTKQKSAMYTNATFWTCSL